MTPHPRSSNLRTKRKFTDQEKDQFLDDAFEYMANFFEESLAELKKRNSQIETRFRRVDANRFDAAIYVNGAATSQCTIRHGGRNSFGSGITYSSRIGGENSFNEALSVNDDGYTLFLKPLGMAFLAHNYNQRNQNLTPEGGAEIYWGLLIEPLQR